uniref:Alpha/beta hydrolase fold-5 domain-containing protein n=1 Tax=uncultured bacterium F42-01 TaxID=1191438 RepID=I3VIK2_9BACT|nr:hypothetical protein [uncultured bacterium F42-01]
MLAYYAAGGRLVRANVPFLFLTLKGPVAQLALRGTGFDLEKLEATPAELQRLGPRVLAKLSAMVLIGTTHPKNDNLTLLQIPVTKVYASEDGIAPPDRVLANRDRLPKHTRWVEIAGGNHSQFGGYGHQLFDGKATIRREEQEMITRFGDSRGARCSRNAMMC